MVVGSGGGKRLTHQSIIVCVPGRSTGGLDLSPFRHVRLDHGQILVVDVFGDGAESCDTRFSWWT